jgi:putative membrane protein
MEQVADKEKKYKKLIVVVSILIPLAVAALLNPDLKIDADFSFLPPIYATTNGVTAVVLIAALLAVKQGKRRLHENLMKGAIALSTAFLLMYVMYHLSSDPTEYKGSAKSVYMVILISHIVLSVAIIPLVLFTYVKAWSGKFEQHKKLARITFPVWLYVTVTGVIVYLMISPYYAH